MEVARDRATGSTATKAVSLRGGHPSEASLRKTVSKAAEMPGHSTDTSEAVTADTSMWGVPDNVVMAGPAGDPRSWSNTEVSPGSFNTGAVIPGETLTLSANIWNSVDGWDSTSGTYLDVTYQVHVTWELSGCGSNVTIDNGQVVTAHSYFTRLNTSNGGPTPTPPRVSTTYTVPANCPTGGTRYVGLNVVGTVTNSGGTSGGRAVNAHTLSAIEVAQAYGSQCGGTASGAVRPQALDCDPVNTATGAFTESFTDATVPAAGVPFALSRGYSSNDTTSGALGAGWTLPWEVSLTVAADGNVTVRDENGARFTYTKTSSGTFTTPVLARSTLTAVSGGGYTLTTLEGQVLTFTTTGLLASRKDRSGQGLTFTYSGGLPVTITDPAGRTVTLSYSGGKLAKATLADGRHVDYGYSSGRLSTVTDLVGGTTTYSYDAAGRLSKINDPRGHDVVSNGYDSSGRVVTQTDATGSASTFAYRSGETDITASDGGVWSDLYAGSLLTARYDPFGNRTYFGYDGYGNRTSVLDPLGDHTTYDYDASGHLITHATPSTTEKWTYASGNVASHTDGRAKKTTYSYDTAGHLTSVTDPAGGVTSLTYTTTTMGLVSSATTPRGKTTSYGYDTAGNLTSVTSPLNERTSYTYDSSGRRLTSTDPLGHATTSTYDDADAVTSITTARGKKTTYAYDAAHNLTSATDPLGAVTAYAYDAADRMTTVTGPGGETTSRAYNTAGLVASVTDPLGATTKYTYDKAHQLVSMVAPRGNVSGANAANYTWKYGYNSAGERVTVTDPSGAATATAYDADRRPVTITDPLGRATAYTYDDTNNITKITRPEGDNTGFTYDDTNNNTKITGGRSYSTVYGYDADHDLVSVTSPLGGKTTYTVDDDGRRLTATDPRGNVSGATPADYTWTYAYDAAGNPTGVTDPTGATAHRSYDADGNITSATDALGKATAYAYDAASRLTSVTAPDAGVTAYTYDSFGGITSRTDADNHTTRYTYDVAHRLTKTTDPLSRSVSQAYDVDGNPTITTNARGQTITTAYNGRGLPTGTTYSDGTTATAYTYDAAGQVTGVTDATGSRTATYDGSGRLLTLSVPGSTTPFTYTYDDDGDVTARTYPDGTKATFTYNSDDEITAQTAHSATVRHTYDAAGNLLTTTLPTANGYTESRTYDRAGRLATIGSANSTATLTSWTATRDVNGRLITVSPVRSGTTAPPTSYGYDANGRLLSECTAPSGSTGCPTGSSKNTYTYDKVGNRLTKAASTSAATTSTSYAYDAADELTSSTTGSTTTPYKYNADGAQTTAGANTFAYNAAGQLTTATVGSHAYAYTYDATGNRTTTRTDGTLSRITHWDVNNPLPQVSDETNGSGTLIADYRYDPLGEPELLHTSAGNFYDHHDLSGSVTDLTSAAGVDQYTYAYDAYGTTKTTALTTSAPANPFAYTGQYQDPAGTALGYQLRARTYDPSTGRFTSTDPAGSSLAEPAISAYAYADDDPTTLTDPSGACPACVSAAVGGIVGGVFGGISYTLSHQNDFSWSGLGRAAGKSALYGIGAGLFMPASGAAAVEFLGLEAGTTAATVTSATVNAGVGAAYAWAFDTALCEPVTPGDLLLGALGGAFSGLGRGGLGEPRAVVDGTGYQWAPPNVATDVLGPGEAWHPSQGIPVIGRLPDTSVAGEWPGYRKLIADPWTLGKNDAWIQSIINHRGTVYVGTPTSGTYWNDERVEPTVFAREIQQLLQAGYRWSGDYLVPPRT
ncbi:tRNA3(Ser-specific nuclease WapA precursor [Streptomyces acidiscabies]|nr:tRNA3(Ser-specific nuclease WapA precursor [Streptomyces acidiscabies]